MGTGSSLGPQDYIKRTKLSQVRLQGSSYRGSIEWLQGRVLGVFAIFLTVYVLIALITGVGRSYESMMAWVHNPINTTVLILAILTSIGHGIIGLLTVVNDYIHNSGMNFFVTLFIKGFFGFIAILSTISILIAAMR